ncbi:MAG: DNA polymerase III subunit gamma/tau [Victivallales bacterium]|nr:DNA polymerase III subunit gamma/tau [Victivallales bacterium]
MAYQVLARKWRPQTFAEVVGQEHITRTLKNAIVHNRVGSAYLFVGSRGIGKTTSARIFAKALNCTESKDGEPCCHCQNCREIASGNSMDVIEIDGASHNKVEDIRDIRDNVQYSPTHGKYKIYIIDEVHMLTPQAWNALLKTLEEPPPHVKFLFATTEPHKVLPTIISRCQRFDLKRIAAPLIVGRLRQIANGEHIGIDDAALAAIARAADGGMRDAQSIFDEIIAFCGGTAEGETIHEQDVIDVFGLASGMELREIASAIFANDLNHALRIVQKLSDSGRDLERLYADLISYVRNLMVAALCRDASSLLEVSDSELADLAAIGKSLDPQTVQRVLENLIAHEWNFRSAINKRIYLEATLARIMLDAHSVQLNDIFTHLNRISGLLPKDSIPEPHRPAPFPELTKAPPTQAVSQTPAPQPVEVKPVVAKPDEQPTPQPVEEPTAPQPVPQPVDAQPVEEPPVQPAPQPVEEPTAPQPVPQPVDAQPVEEPPVQPAPQPVEVKPDEQPVPQPVEEPTAPQPVPQPVAPQPPKPQPEQTATAEGAAPLSENDLLMAASNPCTCDMDEDNSAMPDELEDIDSMAETITPEIALDRVIEQCANLPGESSRLSDLLGTLQPRKLDPKGLLLTYEPRQFKQADLDLLKSHQTQSQLDAAMRALKLAGHVTIQLDQSSGDGKKQYHTASFMERQRIAGNPFIQKMNQLLNAELVDVRIPDAPQ